MLIIVVVVVVVVVADLITLLMSSEIGRASCRERVCLYV